MTAYSSTEHALATLSALRPAVEARITSFDAGDVVSRLWAGDHTLWKPEPDEITNRLEWLTVPGTMQPSLGDLAQFGRAVAADGFSSVVLLGMGGSSLAPEVLRDVLGAADGMPALHVLDTTDPAQIMEVEGAIDLSRTLFVVASKSGGTIETRSQFDYFWAQHPIGASYVAITDPGSALERLAHERGVRRVFLNPAGIGGRYSALSLFGLVPGAMLGVDTEKLLTSALEMSAACREPDTARNPGAWLGAVIGEAALAGRDKLTLVLPPELEALGYWIEQLVAESTGKEDRGVLPVEGEPLGSPAVYGRDRLFVAYGDHAGLEALAAAGHPVVRLPWPGPDALGGEFFRWEFATAIAGHVLRVNPFDQPDVQAAKDVTGRILAGERPSASAFALDSALDSIRPGDYVAITAYLPRNAATMGRLAAVRLALRDRKRVATTVGFGPRFLHSAGQYHRGGPNSGVFLQVVSDDPADLAIPDQGYTFRELRDAQALGDLASLRSRGRRIARVSLEELEAAVAGW